MAVMGSFWAEVAALRTASTTNRNMKFDSQIIKIFCLISEQDEQKWMASLVWIHGDDT